MKVKYKTISLRSIEGIKQAERLLVKGWIIYSSSIDTVCLYKEAKE